MAQRRAVTNRLATRYKQASRSEKSEILDQLEAFVTSGLGKGVVRAKDTPNFIANRIGIAGMLSTMKQAENFGLNFDVVDDLTGKKLGASELREEAAQLFKPVRTSGFLGFGTDKPAGLVTGKDALQIPDNDRTQIEAALKRAGRPVTDAAVEALYRAHSRIPQRTAQN